MNSVLLRVLLLLLVLVSACRKPVSTAVRPPLPSIIGHRGASGAFPENTLAAFTAAFAQGADGIEGDYHLTSDRMIACLHDATTDRVARVARVVRQSTLAQLRELDVGAWKSEAFRGEKIPTLPEVLTLVPPGKLIYVEVKCGPEIVPRLVETLRAGPPTPEQITVISFSEEVVRHAKDRAREFPAYWLVSVKAGLDGAPVPPVRSVIDVLRRSGADGVGLSANPAVDAAYISAIKNAGFRINVWTVNDSAVARRFVTLGVDSITTDHPAQLREALVQTRK